MAYPVTSVGTGQLQTPLPLGRTILPADEHRKRLAVCRAGQSLFKSSQERLFSLGRGASEYHVPEKGASHEWHCRAEMSAQIDLGLPERIF